MSKKKVKKSTKKKVNRKKAVSFVNEYILLDRSGSMQSRWSEALSSINAYAKELQDKKQKGTITVASFDDNFGLQYDLLRDAVAVEDFEPLTNTDATPRGSTPLLDALGRAIAAAEKTDNEKTVIIVMTDGAENASREVTKEQAKAAIDRCKARGWQVLFLGADFDAFGEASSVGVGFANTINMTSGNYGATMQNLSVMRSAYATVGEAMNFSNEVRAQAQGQPDNQISDGG